MRATCPTEADEQPVLGSVPPTVFTRWTLETLLNEPSGPTDLAVICRVRDDTRGQVDAERCRVGSETPFG